MSSETLTFADGTVYENSYAFESSMKLYVYVKNPSITLRDLFEKLMDEESTASIACNRFDDESIFEGYTDLYQVSKESDKLLTAVLRHNGGQNA